MHVGITLFVTDRTMPVGVLAREIEARGFTGLWVGEHTHIPANRDTEWPLEDGEPLPDPYTRMYDPFVALAAAAATTEELTLATGICLVNQHHPLTLAKAVASLDHVSGGRVLFGVGSGWNVEEMRHHGVDPARRGRRMAEHVAAVTELWTQDEAAFDGEWVRFGPSWSWPKPVQHPHPPVLVGGGKAVLPHVVAWADGWMPIEGPMPVLRLLERLHRLAAEAGRDPGELAVYVSYATPSIESLDSYREAGVDGVILKVDPGSADEVLPQLDALAPLAARFAG